jgi:hypothetical protein
MMVVVVVVVVAKSTRSDSLKPNDEVVVREKVFCVGIIVGKLVPVKTSGCLRAAIPSLYLDVEVNQVCGVEGAEGKQHLPCKTKHFSRRPVVILAVAVETAAASSTATAAASYPIPVPQK